MDKNQIKIDDFVRQRLGGGEERERPGAWLAMRELLDEEMPVVATAAYNWRRLLGIAALLLGAGSATFAGYRMMNNTSSQQHSIAARHPVSSAITSSSAKTALNNNSAQATTSTTTASTGIAKPDNAAASQDHRHHSARVSAAVAQVSHVGQARAHAQNLASPVVAGSNILLATTSKSLSASTVSSATPNNIAVDPANLTLPVAASVNSGIHASRQSEAANNNGNKSAAGNVLASATVSKHNTSRRNLATSQKAPASLQSATDVSTASMPSAVAVTRSTSPVPFLPASGMRAANTFSAGPHFNLIIDTIEQVFLAEHRIAGSGTEKYRYRMDTVSRNSVVKNGLVQADVVTTTVPSPAKLSRRALRKQAATANANKAEKTPIALNNTPRKQAQQPAVPVPQAAAPAAESNLVALSDFRVGSRKSSVWNEQAEHFSQMVNKVQQSIARIQFYPGIIAGINASLLSSNTLGGFQFGLTGLFEISERLSLVAEMKYVLRFNTGNTLRDDYYDHSDITKGGEQMIHGVPYTTWSWREDSIDHFFNFSTIQTIEMPLVVRYELGRFYAQGGANLMYAFSINAQETTHPHQSYHAETASYPSSMPPVFNSNPLINAQDFGSRFGFGYLLGVGYQFSPAVKVDLRLTQTLVDNASSIGSRKVSSELYHIPSLQMSIGYRFKQNVK